MNVLDLTDLSPDEHQFLLSVDAEHPRDFQEQIRVGGEYLFLKILALRAGYVSGGDEYTDSTVWVSRKTSVASGLPWTIPIRRSGSSMMCTGSHSSSRSRSAADWHSFLRSLTIGSYA